MILINLLGTKNSDVNLEWEVNELLANLPKYKVGDFEFTVQRDELLPFILEGSKDQRLLRFCFSAEEAILQISDGDNEIEIASRLEDAQTVKVHFNDEVFDSRHTAMGSGSPLTVDTLYGVLAQAFENQDGYEGMDLGGPKRVSQLLTQFGSTKMREAVDYFQEVISHALSEDKDDLEILESILKELDVPFTGPPKSRKKPAKKKKAVKKKPAKKKPAKKKKAAKKKKKARKKKAARK